MTINILLVDDHKVFRMGLNLLLAEESDMEVIAEAGDGQTAISLVQDLLPDIVVMDITMPDMDGIQATRQIKSEFPQTQIISLSIHAGKDFVENMLQAGASGYVLKESALEDLVPGVRAVAGGEIYLSASIKDVVIANYFDRVTELPVAQNTNSVILTTKLHRPVVTPDLVSRDPLLARLNRNPQRPLTLVSAPAGYGKTTLINSWLDSVDCPIAWYQIDTNDNDLILFITYFSAAIQTIFPSFGQQIKILLRSSNLPSLSVLATTLISEIGTVPEPFILVLDDYHLIGKQPIHDLLNKLLHYPHPSLHLVISTRENPPLPFAKMRAKGWLTEIRQNSLRFSTEETAVFLQNITATKIDEETAVRVTKKTEGWVTALRLMALSLQRHGDSIRLMADLPENVYFISEYLVKEVLANQPPANKSFLLKTSILNRLCRPLCKTLCPTIDEDILTQLNQQNLFIISLDHQDQWFRYHHLFQDLLQNQLRNEMTTAEIADLHITASHWFAENDLIDEALQHALAAQDIPYAEQLIENHRYQLMNSEQWARLERWLKLLPDAVVDQNPFLLSALAYCHEYHSQINDMYARRDQAERLMPNLSTPSLQLTALQGEIAFLHGGQYIITGKGQLAIDYLSKALSLLPAEAIYARSYAKGAQAIGYQIIGKYPHAVKLIKEAKEDRTFASEIAQEILNLFLSMINVTEGNLIGLKYSGSECLNLGEKHGSTVSISFGRYFLGVHHYLRNELETAEKYLLPIVENPYLARPFYFINSGLILAYIYAAQGYTNKANQVIQSVMTHVSLTNNPWVIATVEAFQVELALIRGKIIEAQQLSHSVRYNLYPPVRFIYVPQLTEVKLLLAKNKPQTIAAAHTLLEQLFNYVAETHNIMMQINVLALQAMAHHAQDQMQAAMAKLSEALKLAETRGMIRNFVEMGPAMADLLAIKQKQEKSKYITQLLTAFKNDTQPPAKSESSGSPAHTRDTMHPAIDSLTKREKEVFRLLTTNLSPEEIASELVLSVSTIRTHTKRIYSKLDVHTRLQAIVVAQEQGYID